MFTEPECLHVGNTIKQLKDKIEADPKKVYIATQIWTMGQSIWNKFDKGNRDCLHRPAAMLSHEFAQLTDAENPNNKKAPDSDWAITGSINCFAGCLFGTLKENFMACNGFNEEMKEYGWDDWDLIKRVGIYLDEEKKPDQVNVNCENCNDIIVIHQWHNKNYPYNIYNAAERNGRISAEITESRLFKVNENNQNWGIIK
jgi:hypothetical protein